ncbi:CBO0543 family protein [Paenibacillus sp. GCM10023248]|uniref:CBO0543 family protein n=1 Tax=unclassified Paenibacillus TaxID=185978 RepID=UPI002379C478|nr:CBO0543 family protein [Paenibacillus sp. MAHUQ-63]MDD9272179.1 hypothetical protein [Paenibacillus sp. MAHUQ-63]
MDTIILYGVWIITALLLIIFIGRRHHIRAQLSFMFMQVPTWLLRSLAVKGGLIEYPVGFLSMVYKASFTYEFFVYPAVSAIFNVHFPKEKSWPVKIAYTLIFPTVLTAGEVWLETHTDLIAYLNWNWFMSFLSILFTLLISYGYYRWFFKKMEILFGKRQ